ncbi:hypothetical protein L6164_032220 [Bauhinia variegata]|uniref:Uncharacterized protein n=1 Tax=Bauhinia variegata TaxID=167791 RepID=A0ACB9KN51_BAUVA|nr:hypothetical protein L6164_032220 [Bauhinia variegata]
MLLRVAHQRQMQGMAQVRRIVLEPASSDRCFPPQTSPFKNPTFPPISSLTHSPSFIDISLRPREAMKGSFTQSNGGFHRYLKPGALAQLRDSKINARSRRCNSLTQKSLCKLSSLVLTEASISSSSPTEESNPLNQFDGVPTFALRINRPRCLQRKKLFAVTPVFAENDRS